MGNFVAFQTQNTGKLSANTEQNTGKLFFIHKLEASLAGRDAFNNSARLPFPVRSY